MSSPEYIAAILAPPQARVSFPLSSHPNLPKHLLPSSPLSTSTALSTILDRLLFHLHEAGLEYVVIPIQKEDAVTASNVFAIPIPRI
jgi:hypothetical protein